MSMGNGQHDEAVAEVLGSICLPPFFAARAELAGRLESVALLATEMGKTISTRFTSLVKNAKWQEHNDRSNSAIITMADELIEVGVLDLEILKLMARDAMTARKPVNLLNGQQ